MGLTQHPGQGCHPLRALAMAVSPEALAEASPDCTPAVAKQMHSSQH